MRAPDVLVARLSGAARCEVAAVREGQRFFLVAPKRLGGTQEIPADSLTDCMNYGVGELGKRLGRKGKSRRKS